MQDLGLNNKTIVVTDEDDYANELAFLRQVAGIDEELANTKAQELQRQMEDQLNPRRNAALAFHKAIANRTL